MSDEQEPGRGAMPGQGANPGQGAKPGQGANPGRGAMPGFEDQVTQVDLGKPVQVPGDPDSPNADAFDRSAEAEAVRPTDVRGAPAGLEPPNESEREEPG